MSFFRVIAGVDNTDEARNILTTPSGIQIVSIDNISDFQSDPFTGSVANNTSFVATEVSELVQIADFYALELVVPDDVTNLYYAEILIATQAEINVDLIEGTTSVANTSALTFFNRNRNSAAVTTATIASVNQGTDPVTGGNTIISDHVPRDESLKLDFGRLILANDTSYAIKFSSSGRKENQITVRVDLSVLPA